MTFSKFMATSASEESVFREFIKVFFICSSGRSTVKFLEPEDFDVPGLLSLFFAELLNELVMVSASGNL